jgi:hypothetical protein
MRRILKMREVSAPAELIETEIELAKSLWKDAPTDPPPWDSDIQPLAVELGFDPDTRKQEKLDEFVDEQLEAHAAEMFADDIAAARGLYQLVALIDREIQASVSGVSELRVAAAGSTIVLTGTAVDDVAKLRAGSIAQQHAPAGTTVDNQLVVG